MDHEGTQGFLQVVGQLAGRLERVFPVEGFIVLYPDGFTGVNSEPAVEIVGGFVGQAYRHDAQAELESFLVFGG